MENLLLSNPIIGLLLRIEILELAIAALVFWLVMLTLSVRTVLRSIDWSLKCLPAVQTMRRRA
jgi:hypothetical protein